MGWFADGKEKGQGEKRDQKREAHEHGCELGPVRNSLMSGTADKFFR